MGRRNIVIAAVAAILVLAAGAAWYFLSPGMAVSSLREAALHKDKDELAERIDFPALRDSIKSQLSARLAAEMAKQDNEANPFGAIGGAIAMGFIGPMIDGMITPDGMVAVLDRGRFADPAKPDSVATEPEVKWTLEREGFDRFRAKAAGSTSAQQVSLVFKRDGLGWKMVDIEIPKEGLRPKAE
jgi:hypothetical protein